jgi:hypothetical protein
VKALARDASLAGRVHSVKAGREGRSVCRGAQKIVRHLSKHRAAPTAIRVKRYMSGQGSRFFARPLRFIKQCKISTTCSPLYRSSGISCYNSLMDFLRNLHQNLTPLLVIKFVGIGIVALLALSWAYYFVGSTLGPIFANNGSMIAPSAMPTIGYGYGGGGIAYDSVTSSDGYYMEKQAMSPQLSARNVSSILPPQGTTGDTAEEFEVTQYQATIETGNLEKTCGDIVALKVRKDVIFENANTYDRGCSYTFKVEHKSVEDVLAILKKLDPKELSENTYTIKSQIEDFTSEVDVLEKKRASIDATLSSALRAYDEITQLATRTQNAEALASIIHSRIGIIERLTQEKIAINEQLDRLARAKAQQLDRLDYTYFNVSVYENKFIDGEQITDSWKAAIRQFVVDLNLVVQGLTISLILFVFVLIKWLLYAAILFIVAKYGWKFVKSTWQQ